MRKIIFLFLIFSTISFAQDGSLDASFNSSDIGNGSGDGLTGYVNVSNLQNDGKVIVGGYFTGYNNVTRNNIARLNSDGSLDTSFGSVVGASGSVYSIAIQSDGKILIGGLFTSYNNNNCNYIARLNSNGTFDSSFSIGTGANGQVNSIAIQSDGKILVGGNFSSFNGISKQRIVRLNSDGSIDNTFLSGSGLSSLGQTELSSIIVQPDNKIVLCGSFTSYNGNNIKNLVRLNGDGTIDPTFNIGVGPNGEIVTMAIQVDGKIVLGGFFTSYNGIVKNRIVRLNGDGTLDPSFTSGNGFNGNVNSISLTSSNKIIIGGSFTQYNSNPSKNIVGLNIDGTLDSTFSIGSGANAAINSISIQFDDKIIIGGSFNFFSNVLKPYINRLNSDGSVDLNFNQSTGVFSSVNSVDVQDDGKVILAGKIEKYNGILTENVIRVNADGSLDPTFYSPSLSGGINSGGFIKSTSTQPDGKIIICGNFTSYQGIQCSNNIARLNSNGTLDTSFSQTPGFISNGTDNYVNISRTQADDKIIIGGDFNYYYDIPVNRLARLNVDSSLDVSFNNGGTGFNGSVYSLSIQSDGKLIVGGGFTSYNGTSSNYIVRLNTDGTKDNTFNIGTGGSFSILTSAIQSDGKILLGGDFTGFNGSFKNRIVRLNEDGSIDTSFSIGSGANGTISSIKIQLDGKIIIVGSFTSYNGVNARRVARLNIDGSLDTTFTTGLGANNFIYAVDIQPDSKIIVGGLFTSYNGVGRNRLARLNSTSLSNNQNYLDENNLVISTNDDILNINSTLEKIKNIKIYDISGRLLLNKNNLNDLKLKINEVNKKNQILIIQVYFSSNLYIVRKVVF